MILMEEKKKERPIWYAKILHYSIIYKTEEKLS